MKLPASSVHASTVGRPMAAGYVGKAGGHGPPYALLLAASACALLALGYAGLGLLAPGATAPLPFNATAAMDAAGRAVPPEIEEFAFFVLDENEPQTEDIPALAGQLSASARAHEHLGITGPDPARNRLALLGALARQGARRLDGVVIIYLGPLEQRVELTERVRQTGAELRFVEFPLAALSI